MLKIVAGLRNWFCGKFSTIGNKSPNLWKPDGLYLKYGLGRICGSLAMSNSNNSRRYGTSTSNS